MLTMKHTIRVPTVEQCFSIMNEMAMMDHIVAHSCQVCHVALSIVDLLKAQDISLNRDIVCAAALLHDITKTRSLSTGENHALTGAQLLRELGYHTVADVVRQHVRLDSYNTDESPREEEIVNYADKRVLHDEVVTLQQRKTYIIERYGGTAQRHRYIHELFENTKKLEEKIFIFLPIPSAKITSHLNLCDVSSDVMTRRNKHTRHATSNSQ